MSAVHFPAGALIFREGDKSNEAYFIVSGSVEISIATEQGPHVLALLGPGEIFGEMGMISDRPRSATAHAKTATMVEVVDESVFEAQILQRQDRLHAYLSTLFERIRHADTQLQMRGEGKPPARGPATPGLRHKLTLQSCYEAGTWRGAPIDMEITKFPFRIGRAFFDGQVAIFARNDLSLVDHAPFHLSRNHCEIDRAGEGFVLRDRGSRLGTWVNGQQVAIDAQCYHAALREGDNTLVFGAAESPHRFLLRIERE